MKIRHTAPDRTVLFKDLAVGDVFKDNGDYFMRIKDIYRDCRVIANSISLWSGAYDCFDDDKAVTWLNATLCVDD